LFVEILEGGLTEATYDGFLAGLSNSTMFNFEGLDVHVAGYNEKLPVLLDTVLCKMRSLVVDQAQLDVYVEYVRAPPGLGRKCSAAE
jgi:insulysin